MKKLPILAVLLAFMCTAPQAREFSPVEKQLIQEQKLAEFRVQYAQAQLKNVQAKLDLELAKKEFEDAGRDIAEKERSK